MAEQQDSGGGKASALRKEKKSKGKGKDAGDEFPLSTKHMVIVGVVAVLLIAMRVGYDDGSKKSQEDDLLDGQDLYEVMEISKSSSDRDVKKAYHKLAMKWHPDKNAGCDDCMLKFQRVARAYEVLSDPMKRKIYDKEQKMMEKAIKSDAVHITTANYKELLAPGTLWLIQVYVDWSDRCQHFAPMWEEVHNRLQGTINIGRINLGRDKGLGSRLQGSKDGLPSVAVWDGSVEVRRLRWAFHDISVEGLIKFVAQAAAERYKAKTLTEQRELQAFLSRTDRVRALFVGKAGSKEQISFTVAAGGIAPKIDIAITSKMSVGQAALADVKPPAVLIFRGDADGDRPVVVSGRVKQGELMRVLEANKRVLCPKLSRDNYALTCGTHKWCALLVVKTMPSSAQVASILAAAADIYNSIDVSVEVGVLSLRSQSKAAALLGAAAAGDVVVLRRAEHGLKAVGTGSLDAWSIAAAKGRAAEDEEEMQKQVMESISAAVEGKQRPKMGGGSEQVLVEALVEESTPMLTRVLEGLDDLSVETQIVLYVVGFFGVMMLLCPCIKPLLQAATMSLDRDYIDRRNPAEAAGQAGGNSEEEEEDEEEDEEDEDEDTVLVKKRS